MSLMSTIPIVSIIIPTFNSEKTLENCLISIKHQTYTNVEILIVDGGSNDETINIAKKYTQNIFILNGKERSPSINFGVKKSIGKYIYRVDSDVTLANKLIEEAVNKCDLEKYDAISIMWSPDPTISFWAKVRKLEKDCYKFDLNHNAARFIRRDIFLKLSGFNEEMVAGEDYDLQNRLIKNNYKIGFIKSEELHLGEPKSIIDIMKKQYYYGKTLNSFLKSNKLEGFIQVSPFRGSLFKNWKNFVIHPILTIGFFIYEFTIYISALFGFIVSYTKNL